MKNIDLEQWEYDFIMGLPKFDLVMFLSDINDNGWVLARKTLHIMHEAATSDPDRFYANRSTGE